MSSIIFTRLAWVVDGERSQSLIAADIGFHLEIEEGLKYTVHSSQQMYCPIVSVGISVYFLNLLNWNGIDPIPNPGNRKWKLDIFLSGVHFVSSVVFSPSIRSCTSMENEDTWKSSKTSPSSIILVASPIVVYKQASMNNQGHSVFHALQRQRLLFNPTQHPKPCSLHRELHCDRSMCYNKRKASPLAPSLFVSLPPLSYLSPSLSRQ